METPKSYCFDVEEFRSPDFNPATFLGRLQLESSLDNLRDDLQSYLMELKQQLYDLINRDYGDFLAVSSRLAGVEDRTGGLGHKMGGLLLHTKRVQAAAGSALGRLESRMEERRQVRLRQKVLQRSIRFAKLLLSTERLLGLNSNNDDKEEDEEKGEIPAKTKGNLEDSQEPSLPSGGTDGGSKEVMEILELDGFREFELGGDLLSGSKEDEVAGDILADSGAGEAGGGRGESVVERCARLERATHDVVVLVAETKKGTVPPLIRGLSLRAGRCESEVTAKLSNLLAQEIFAPRARRAAAVLRSSAEEDPCLPVLESESAALLHCLRSLCLLGRGEVASKLLADYCLAPFLHLHFTQGNLDGGLRGSCSNLGELYSKMETYLKAVVGPLVQVAEPLAGSGGGHVDFMCGGVWYPIHKVLGGRLGGSIFSAGLADSFHANYCLSMAFLEKLAHLAGPQHHSAMHRRLQSDPNVQEFLGRWNLPIYFQLRFGEISSRLDKALELTEREGLCPEAGAGAGGGGSTALPQEASAGEVGGGEKKFDLPVLQEAWGCLQYIWGDGVFLAPLTHRFMCLTLQVLQRLSVWVQQERWKRGSGDIVLVAFDCDRLCHLVRHHLQGRIAQQVSGSTGKAVQGLGGEEEGKGGEAAALACELVEGGLAPCTEAIRQLWQDLVKDIAQQCAHMLQAVRGITATYRMTNKPAPTKPSPFVPNILKPLRDFSQEWGDRVPEQAAGWKHQVLNIVTERYVEVVLELLGTVKQMEDSLKKRRGASRQSKGGLSDADKILLQLLFNIREFGHELETFGLKLEDNDSYQKLLEQVLPAEKFMPK